MVLTQEQRLSSSLEVDLHRKRRMNESRILSFLGKEASYEQNCAHSISGYKPLAKILLCSYKKSITISSELSILKKCRHYMFPSVSC